LTKISLTLPNSVSPPCSGYFPRSSTEEEAALPTVKEKIDQISLNEALKEKFSLALN
jgi:hypothetical protein